MKETDPNFRWKVAGSFVWGIPWTAAGVILCITTIGIPVGILMLLIGAYPLQRTIRKHTERQLAWSRRDHPLPNDVTPPWMIDESVFETDRVEPDA